MEANAALQRLPTTSEDWRWRFTALEAEVFVRQRLNKEALALLEPDLPKSLLNSDVAVWKMLTQAMAYCYLSRFTEAERLLSDAKALSNARHPELLGEVALREGTLAFWRDDRPQAEAAYRRALQIARELHDPFLETAALGSLGLIATRLEHYDASIDWNRQALRMSQSIGATDSVAIILGNMGWSYFELGDYENALALFEQADQASAKSGSIGAQLDWQIAIAAVRYYTHSFPMAEQESQKALALARQLDAKSSITECLNNLSSISLAIGRIDRAEKYNDEALSLSRASQDRSGEISSNLLAARIEGGRGHSRTATVLLDEIVRNPASETSLRWEAEARLARIFADQKHSTQAEREFQRAIGTIEVAHSSVKSEELQVAFLSSAIEFYNDYVNFLIAQRRPGDALAVAERSRAQTLTAGLTEPSQALATSFPRVNAQQLAARFHSMLLFYSLGTPHSYLWVITPKKTTLLSLPSQSEIDTQVKSYREQILDGDDPLQAPNSPASKLYSMLVQPAAKLIPSGSRVIVLPDGGLYSLNFETLIVTRPAPHYWIEDVTLTTANSLTLLQRSQSTLPPPNPRLFLVGDPISSDDQFPPLRQAAREIALVKGRFPEDRRRILAGKEATPSSYFSAEPDRFDYLHFVTHGTASRTHPLDSAVILTKSGDSTKLYAHEIITRPLHAYLVTVSACDGVGKRTYAGEGLVGLSWAFLRAGAHHVIASLWEVNDDSTPQLMDGLYRGLRAGQDPATALRNAKLSLVRSQGVFRKPFYWAPFQLYAGS